MTARRLDRKGLLLRGPERRLKVMIALQGLWLVIVCLLGAWWGRLVLIQAERIAELEREAGMASGAAHDYWERTQRMLYWESGTFFALMLATGILVVVLYWRDARRTRSLQAFFASLTHELRTPLTSIRLQAETLADLRPDDPSRGNVLSRLLEDTHRMETQVERTLELSRLEGGGNVLAEAVELRPLVERTLMLNLHSGGKPDGDRLGFHVSIPEGLTAEADPRALEVILRNLVENSMRHSGLDRVDISITASSKEGLITIRYRDNGRGLQGDAREAGKLFHKGPGSTGAGVGLYLVRALMERMGGRAELVRTRERGFTIDLYLWESNHEREEAREPDPGR